MKPCKTRLNKITVLLFPLTIVPVNNVLAAEVDCTGTLYFCSYNTGDNITVTTSDDASITPLKGYGIYLNSSKIDLGNVTITTSGSAADGIFSNGNNGSYFISTGKVNINASGSSADGINLGVRGGPGSSPGTPSNNVVALNSEDGGQIVAQGIGVRANNNLAEDSNSIIILGNNFTIKQTGTSVDNGLEGDGYAVYAGNRDQDISGFGMMDWLVKGYRNNNKGDSVVFIGAARTTGAGEAQLVRNGNHFRWTLDVHVDPPVEPPTPPVEPPAPPVEPKIRNG